MTHQTMSSESPPQRRQIKKLEAMVADVIQETHDSTTLLLFTGNDQLDYKPGHFITLDPHDFPALERWVAYLEDLKGKKESARAYSLYSAPHEKHLSITIKEERYESGKTKFPPLLSPLLVRGTPRGTRLTVTGFTGPYVLPPDIEDRTDHLIHICAGSGIVPNMSIVKHAIHHGMKLKHTMVVSNKNAADIIYRDELAKLNLREDVRVIHALTREPDAAAGIWRGRINTQLLSEVINDPSAVEVFVCGPGITKWDRKAAKAEGSVPAPRFLEAALHGLSTIGVPKDRIHRESYG